MFLYGNEFLDDFGVNRFEIFIEMRIMQNVLNNMSTDSTDANLQFSRETAAAAPMAVTGPLLQRYAISGKKFL